MNALYKLIGILLFLISFNVNFCAELNLVDSEYNTSEGTGLFFPTTTRIPDRIIDEWGTINNLSMIIFPRSYYSFVTTPNIKLEWNITIHSRRFIDGIRLTSIDDTIESGELIAGGIGHTFLIMRVIAYANYLNCLIERFENGTYDPPIPDRVVMDQGNTDEDTKLNEKRFSYYPEHDVIANRNETLEASGIIHGMRMTSMNLTFGSFSIIAGGFNERFVTINFNEQRPGRPYDFKLELFGNKAKGIKMSIIVILISSIMGILIK
ncbi:uncharacterized protein [Chironomus tepperi]|uniref:uncharacterized protein n=1 Tax=Chironomus tepperi TaxID=113505 RepID=UPI00391F9523